jgi:hypothetical protein
MIGRNMQWYDVQKKRKNNQDFDSFFPQLSSQERGGMKLCLLLKSKLSDSHLP